MTSPMAILHRWFGKWVSRPKSDADALCELYARLSVERPRLTALLESADAPRIALVKQDVCEDLYCGPIDASPRELLESTQLRSGPLALLTAAHARFQILETVAAPECNIWQERATDLKWDTLEFFASYRVRIPGCDYGQSRFAVSPHAVDWSQYDIVISIDVAVPASVTQQYPQTSWAYYVREIKAPSYQHGLTSPAPGQDLFLNHGFRWHPPAAAAHVVEFPYHLQYAGCFHEVFELPFHEPRHGLFVDHHTLVNMAVTERQRFTPYGPLVGPELPAPLQYEGGKSVPPRRTMDPDLRERLLNSKYFLITPGQRRVFGTALVEAIAAGCLAIGSPQALAAHGFLFSPQSSAKNTDEALARIEAFENDHDLYLAEVRRQRSLVDWVCYVRPLLTLFDKAAEVVARRSRT